MKHPTPNPTTREQALALDAADPLAPLRELFDIPPGVIYLDGNSLGVLPRATAARVQQVVRDVFVAESDDAARKWVREGNMARAWRENNFPTLDLFGWRKFLKHDESVPDAATDVDYLIDHLFLVGSPETVARRLFTVDEALGGFGTVVLNAYDWGDDAGPYRRSMELFAREVIPRFESLRTGASA